MEHRVVKSGGFQLAYKVFGEGTQTVVCLHGHGRSAEDFLFLNNRDVRVISIHLFLHDESFIPADRIEKKPLEWPELFPVFEKIFEQEKTDRFHMLAFSQGGRFAMLLLETIPEKIQSFTLLAPDGLNNNSFYNWSSRRKYMRRLMQGFVENPESIRKWANVTTQLRLMRPKVNKFVHSFSDDPETFIRASHTWMAFRNLQPDPVKIGSIVRKHQITFIIITGVHDQIIQTKSAARFLKKAGLPASCLMEIESGHDFFKPAVILKFLPLLPFSKG